MVIYWVLKILVTGYRKKERKPKSQPLVLPHSLKLTSYFDVWTLRLHNLESEAYLLFYSLLS